MTLRNSAALAALPAIEAAAPGAAGAITFEETPLPLPEALATGGLEQAIGPVAVTPLEGGVAATVAHFRSLAHRSWCTVNRRALNPLASKKFFVSRWPGSA